MSAIYIQHAHNRSFYYGVDRWVLGRRRAQKFPDTHNAIAFCVERALAYAQVNVSFGPGAADVVIPVNAQMPVAAAAPDGVVWE